MIQRAAERMNRLIGDLLDHSRAAVGLPLTVRIEEQDVRNVLNEVCEAANMRAKPKAIRITCEIPEDPGSIPMDRDRILQALANLVDNAICFTPENGWIRVGCEKNADGVLIYVINSGEPMSLDQV